MAAADRLGTLRDALGAFRDALGSALRPCVMGGLRCRSRPGSGPGKAWVSWVQWREPHRRHRGASIRLLPFQGSGDHGLHNELVYHRWREAFAVRSRMLQKVAVSLGVKLRQELQICLNYQPVACDVARRPSIFFAPCDAPAIEGDCVETPRPCACDEQTKFGLIFAPI